MAAAVTGPAIFFLAPASRPEDGPMVCATTLQPRGTSWDGSIVSGRALQSTSATAAARMPLPPLPADVRARAATAPWCGGGGGGPASAVATACRPALSCSASGQFVAAVLPGSTGVARVGRLFAAPKADPDAANTDSGGGPKLLLSTVWEGSGVAAAWHASLDQCAVLQSAASVRAAAASAVPADSRSKRRGTGRGADAAAAAIGPVPRADSDDGDQPRPVVRLLSFGPPATSSSSTSSAPARGGSGTSTSPSATGAAGAVAGGPTAEREVRLRGELESACGLLGGWLLAVFGAPSVAAAGETSAAAGGGVLESVRMQFFDWEGERASPTLPAAEDVRWSSGSGSVALMYREHVAVMVIDAGLHHSPSTHSTGVQAQPGGHRRLVLAHSMRLRGQSILWGPALQQEAATDPTEVMVTAEALFVATGASVLAWVPGAGSPEVELAVGSAPSAAFSGRHDSRADSQLSWAPQVRPPGSLTLVAADGECLWAVSASGQFPPFLRLFTLRTNHPVLRAAALIVGAATRDQGNQHASTLAAAASRASPSAFSRVMAGLRPVQPQGKALMILVLWRLEASCDHGDCDKYSNGPPMEKSSRRLPGLLDVLF